MRRTILSCVMASSLLTGCATYHPSPLAAVEPVDPPAYVRPQAPLTPDALAALAVERNTGLAALAANAGITEAQRRAASLLPDPVVGFGAARTLGGSNPVLALAGALGFDLNALRMRPAVRAQADALARQSRLDVTWAAWQVGAAARLQAARINGYSRIVSLDRASVANARDLVDRVGRAGLLIAGASERQQAARLALLDATDRLRSSEQALLAARYVLAGILNVSLDALPSVTPEVDQTNIPDRDTLVAAALQDRPDLAALRAGHDASEAGLRKAVLDQFPAFALGINGGRDSDGKQTLGPSVSFTLPLWNRNRGGIAIAEATRQAVEADYQSRVAEARNAIAAALGQMQLATAQRDRIVEALPELRRMAAASKVEAGRGDLPFASAAATDQTLRDRERQLAESNLTITEERIALALLTGNAR